MFCPACGSKTQTAFKYCKQCGANLTPAMSEEEAKSLAVVSYLALPSLFSLASLIALFITLFKLTQRGLDAKFIMGIAAVGGITILGVVAMLIWLILRLKNSSSFAPRRTTGALEANLYQPAAQLPAPSVVEHTTRNFAEPVFVEHHARETKGIR